MTTPSQPPIACRYVPWLNLFYYGIAALALMGLAGSLAWRIGDWRLGLLPAVAALYFVVRILLARILILVASERELTIVRRPILHWLGSFEIIPAADIRRVRYSLHVHEKKDDDGETYNEDHFRLDVITHDSRIIKIIDSDETTLPRKTLRNMANLMRVPFEESLNRPD